MRPTTLALLVVIICTGTARALPLLDPATQPRWVNPLPIPSAYQPASTPAYPGADYYEIHVTQFEQWMGLYVPGTRQRLYTTVWGYGALNGSYDTGVRDAQGNPILQSGSTPGSTFETRRGIPVVVKWINDLRNPDGSPMTRHLLEDAYDTTLHGADMGEPHVRMVVHVHGAEVQPDSDGFPDFWLTPDPLAAANGLGGPPGNSVIYQYPNLQPPTTLWYHDHTLASTRLNVFSGEAGFFLIREPAVEDQLDLPSGPYEIPLLIQDRMFNTDGSLSYLNTVNTPGTPYHPKAAPEFFGNVILVNGMAWPSLAVEPRQYRFRILNGSNARMYNLRFVTQSTRKVWKHVWQIGSDGGYLRTPVRLVQSAVRQQDAGDRSTKLFLAPAERADVIVDFSGVRPGVTFLLTNDARAPFPDGDRPERATVGRIMQFRVVPLGAPDPSRLPARLTPLPTRIDASQVTRVRHMTLTEVEDPVTGNPVVGLLNNTCWDEPLTEQPKLGTTEVWEIANTTADTHPIHIHLVQFNLLNRQRFDTRAYLRAYNAMNGGGRLPGPIPYCPPTVDPVNPPGVATDAQVIPLVDPYLRRHPIPPGPTEAGFKDTVRVKKDTVTRFLVRFGPHDRAQHGPYGGFAFDPTRGRYVWHCHILEHEDNDMMRPYAIVN